MNLNKKTKKSLKHKQMITILLQIKEKPYEYESDIFKACKEGTSKLSNG